jgi:uncharacterized cupin superfamily protein
MKPASPKPAIKALDAPPRSRASNYPEPFASRMKGREKRPLGELFGLTNFGVNLTRLAPGSQSALRHAHSRQDEFIYVLKAGTGDAHHLVNRSGKDVVYLEIGDRTAQDEGTYPDDDLKAALGPDGKWGFTRKDGTPY